MAETTSNRPRGRPAAATREQFLEAATGRFLARQRIDVQAICAELGLSRATVHRWCGSRDEVIGEVMVRLVAPLFRRVAGDGSGRGGRRLVEVFERQLRLLADDPALRSFLESEPGAALRILTASDGIVEPRVVELIKESIDAEVARGYEPPADPAVLAYAIVRMGESFLYADPRAGFRGDFDRLRDVYAALLGVKP